MTTGTTMNTPPIDPRIVALAKHLDCNPDEISEASYDDNENEAGEFYPSRMN